MQPTVYQKPEIRDANDNIIQQGAFGKNTALANSTNDGWIDYVANDLEFLYDLAKDEVVPVPSLPASGQTNKTYLLTTTGVSYRWSGTQWVAVSSSEAVGRAESAANLAEQWATKTDGSVDGTEYSAKYYAEQAEASADDAQDTADDMATHLVQIDKNTGGVSKNSKRISNIEKLLQGNLYDYDTDDDSAYTKTVPSGALPYAGVEKIGGKTLVMNQFIQNGDFSADTGWTYSNGTTHSLSDGVATIVGAVDNYFAVYLATSRALNVWAGHKYLISAVVSNDVGRVVLVPTGSTSGGYETFNDVSTPTRIFYLYTPASDGSVRMHCRFHNATVGTEQTVTGTISNYMCIDLTRMFGSGNEPTTVQEFQQMFPASYYPYNAGTLLSAGVTEVESEGKNLVPTYTESGSGNGLTWTANADGSLTINGTATADTYIRPAEYSTWTWDGVTPCWLSGCPASGGTTRYQLRMDTETDGLARATPDNGSGRELSNNSSSHPIQGLPLRFCIVIRSGFVCDNLTFRPMLEYGSVATSYSPYLESSFPIPAEVKALDGYGWSAGTAYNYIDFERKVFVKRVGRCVVNGNNNLSYNSTYDFYTTSAGSVNPVGMTWGYKLINTWIPLAATTPNITGDLWLQLNGNGDAVRICNKQYTTKEDFKAWLSAKPITFYYELATPIETDISAYLTDNLIEVGAGGTLTFPNANGDDYHIPVPSTETYMIDLQEAVANG